MAKKKKPGCIIVLILLLAVAVFLGIKYYNIKYHPADQFKNAPTAVPTSNTGKVAPLIPITRPTETP